MSTKDIADEANDATDALLALSEAGKVATKQRKKEIKAARKRQAAIAYAARLAARAEQDKIDEAQEVLDQIDPDLEEAPQPVVASAPNPRPEPAALVVAEPEPKVVEKVEGKVVDLNPELVKENEALRKEAEQLKAELDKKSESIPTPEPVVAPVVAAEPEPKVDSGPSTKPLPAASNANPNYWGYFALLLAVLGLLLGWFHVGPWAVDLVPDAVWDWFAWLGRPITAALGFFGGGWIGQSLVRLWEKKRTRLAEA